MKYLKLNEKDFSWGYLLLKPKVKQTGISKCIAIIKGDNLTKILWFNSQTVETYKWDIRDLVCSDANKQLYSIMFITPPEFEKFLNEKEISIFRDKIRD